MVPIDEMTLLKIRLQFVRLSLLTKCIIRLMRRSHRMQSTVSICHTMRIEEINIDYKSLSVKDMADVNRAGIGFGFNRAFGYDSCML